MSKVSYDFAISEMRNNGDNVRKWANQTDNPLLRELAIETLQAAGEAR